MQYMILECKYLSGQTVILTPAFWFALPYHLEFLQYNLLLLQFLSFPGDKRFSITQSYFLGSSRGSVLHDVLHAKSPGAAGLCTNWGFIFTAKPQSCFKAVQLHFCGDPALSFCHEENFRGVDTALASPSKEHPRRVSIRILQQNS